MTQGYSVQKCRLSCFVPVSRKVVALSKPNPVAMILLKQTNLWDPDQEVAVNRATLHASEAHLRCTQLPPSVLNWFFDTFLKDCFLPAHVPDRNPAAISVATHKITPLSDTQAIIWPIQWRISTPPLTSRRGNNRSQNPWLRRTCFRGTQPGLNASQWNSAADSAFFLSPYQSWETHSHIQAEAPRTRERC